MSSVLSRLFRREGTSKIEFSGAVSKNAPPTFVPELIRSKIWNVEDVEHLEKVARYDPVARFIVFEIAEQVFDDGFKFVDKDGNEIMPEALKELRALNAKRVFTQALAAMRWGGWCWVYTGKNRYIPQAKEGGKIATLRCFTRKNCSVFDYDDVGNPKTMKLELSVGKGNTQTSEVLYLPASDFIKWDMEKSILEPVWDMLVYLRYELHAMTFFDIKIGHGLFTAFTKGGLSDDARAKWQTAFEDISIKRALVVDSGDIDKIEFIGPTGHATNFYEHITAVLEMIAVGASMPKDLLVGAAAGSVTGSETNLTVGRDYERQVQEEIEEYIRETLRRMGWSNDTYEIEWIAKYAHDEESRSKIDYNKALTLEKKLGWMTINEIRELEGLPPKEGGDELKTADFEVGFEKGQTPDEQEQTRNKEGTQI